MVERRNLGFMEKFINVAKLLSSFTVGKRWCRKSGPMFSRLKVLNAWVKNTHYDRICHRFQSEK